MTLISGLFGVFAAFLLMFSNKYALILAGISIQLFKVLDWVDGDIARMKIMCSSYGQWFDICFDKLNVFYQFFIKFGVR